MDPYRFFCLQLALCQHPDLFLVVRETGKPLTFDRRNPDDLRRLKLPMQQPTAEDLCSLRMRLRPPFTQEQMAAAAGIQHQSTYARLESGGARMDVFRWKYLQLQLGCHPIYELRRRSDPDRSIDFLTGGIQNANTLRNDEGPDAGDRGRDRGAMPGVGHNDHGPVDHSGHVPAATPVLEPSIDSKRAAIQLIREAIDEVGIELDVLLHELDPKRYPAIPGVEISSRQSAQIKLIGETMADEGLLPKHLVHGPKPINPGDVRYGAKVTKKRYRDPESGKTWSGRGPAPEWLHAALMAFVGPAGASWTNGALPKWLLDALKNDPAFAMFRLKDSP